MRREATNIRDDNDGRDDSEDLIRIGNTAVQRSIDGRDIIDEHMSCDGTDVRGGSDGRDRIEDRMGRIDTDCPVTRVTTESSYGSLPRELAEESSERGMLINSLAVMGVALPCLNGNSARTRSRRRRY